MSVFLKILLLLIISFCRTNRVRRPQNTANLPFPHLIDFNESDISKPYYTFDGVDYDKVPAFPNEVLFNKCYEEYTRCTRMILYVNPVCGYHTYENKLMPFYSICELDLSSCNEMKRKKIPMHGTTYRQRGVYFMGEGNKCEMYVRRIAEGLVPRDIRDPPQDVSETMVNYDVVTREKDLQHDNTEPKLIPNSDYDYENIMY